MSLVSLKSEIVEMYDFKLIIYPFQNHNLFDLVFLQSETTDIK